MPGIVWRRGPGSDRCPGPPTGRGRRPGGPGRLAVYPWPSTQSPGIQMT